MKLITRYLLSVASLLAATLACSLPLAGCGSRGATVTASSSSSEKDAPAASAPRFEADSAYALVKEQLECGPRIPGSEGHARAAGMLQERLRAAAPDTLMVTHATVRSHTGAPVPITNIMASWNPTAPRRLLFLAHYDTRPHADEDPDPAKRSLPVPGANDGASGTAVLLEVARLLSGTPAPVGVDILLVDAEDMGVEEVSESWCLGSTHWAENLPYGPRLLTPAYAVLLDMVGGKGARFNPEYLSMSLAPQVVSRLWSRAHASGFASFFPTAVGAAVTDDHIPVNMAGIPAVDIIENRSVLTGSFPPYWHTTADDLSAISPETLRAVGQTVTDLIYLDN